MNAHALRLCALTLAAMLAFAANSVLCRLALKTTAIDPATFTGIRIVAGASVLAAFIALRRQPLLAHGNWISASALFAYAAAFSFAYVGLAAGTGALLLFAAVQATMIAYALQRGERLHVRQWLGLLVSMIGLVVLLLPGLSAPPPLQAALMLSAGLAWGVYSIRGRGCADPAAETAANFVRAMLPALLLSVTCYANASLDRAGAVYAVLSGALTSGLGYVIWYAALSGLSSTSAAVVQLSVPALAAAGGVWFLGESLTLRLLLASSAILGGIALVVVRGKR